MRKTVRGIPILTLIVLGLLSVVVLGAAFSPWLLTNTLTQPTPPPAEYTGDAKSFTISAPGVGDDAALVTITLTGLAQPNSLVTATTRLAVLKPDWQIKIHSITTVVVKNPSGAVVATFTHDSLDPIGKSGEPYKEWTDTFTPLVTGDYTITPSVTTMQWWQPP